MTDTRIMDLPSVLAAWSIPAPWTVTDALGGLNNLSRRVETSTGSYFLRVYQNTRDLGRIRYEHALLMGLQDAGLPFAVPLPLTTRAGDTYSVFASGRGEAVAALFPAIRGQRPHLGDAAAAMACGLALAQLDETLAQIELDHRLSTRPTFGDLLTEDTFAETQELPISIENRTSLQTLLRILATKVPNLYRQSPQQVIHSDLGRANALLIESRVSGLLDFELASPDLRAMDFAVGLWAFGLSALEVGRAWECIEAFSAGYGRRVRLTREEIAALPTLLRLREAASLIHWGRRFQRGLTDEKEIARRATSMIDLDMWLSAYGEELVQRAEASR